MSRPPSNPKPKPQLPPSERVIYWSDPAGNTIFADRQERYKDGDYKRLAVLFNKDFLGGAYDEKLHFHIDCPQSLRPIIENLARQIRNGEIEAGGQ